MKAGLSSVQIKMIGLNRMSSEITAQYFLNKGKEKTQTARQLTF